MNWESIYLFCFIFGLLLSTISFLSGAGHIHIPHVHLHLHVGHGHAAPMHHGAVGRGGPAGRNASMSPFNFATFTAFLAWFGGAGYLLTKYSSLWFVLALVIATGAGLTGAAVVFWFLVKLLLAADRALDDSDYDMIGVLGRVSSGIREGGTGELIFSQEGTRRCCGARSETGVAIGRGIEVVVTKYEKGIAYVRPWEEMAGMDDSQADSAGV